MQKKLDFTSFRPPRGPGYNQRYSSKWRWEPYYDIHRPWEDGFETQNAPMSQQPKVYVEPIRDWYLYRGDRVEVLTGKDKGKQGHIISVIVERNWVFVEGLNCSKRLDQKTDFFPGILRLTERPLLVPRDVALVDPSDKLPTKVEWRFDEEGNEVRVSLRTGRIIPLPASANETIDFKDAKSYPEQAKDTKDADVKKVTFQPVNKTFEMDIMEKHGIKEDRVPYPMYWY